MSDADCVFFQKMADQGSHYGKRAKGKSRQGTYVFTASGKLLASINDLSADNVLRMLERGLAEWKRLPDAEKLATADQSLDAVHRWEKEYPRDGLVLNGVSRDLHDASNVEGADATAERLPTWNRDTAWFSKVEAASLIPTDATVGSEFDFPEVFVSRLVKLHFVDLVKGQSSPYSKNEIAGSRLSGKVVRADGDRLFIDVRGVTAAQTKKKSRWSRGLKTRVVGDAVFDRKQKVFSKFEMVALGERWGRTRFNDRRRQMEPTSIGFVFQMAPRDAEASVPGIIWAYDAPWLKGPNQ